MIPTRMIPGRGRCEGSCGRIRKIKTNAAGEKLGEMFIDRRGGKTITRGTVVLAYKKALELGNMATGPKKLGVFGASYIYPVFVEIGVCGKPHSTERN